MTVIFNLSLLLGVKIIRLLDRADLFKFSNLDLGGKAIVTSPYSKKNKIKSASNTGIFVVDRSRLDQRFSNFFSSGDHFH